MFCVETSKSFYTTASVSL